MNVSNQIKDICKIGQGEFCCRYLLAGAKGFECGKLNKWKDIIDKNWKVTPHVAQGDNCNGQLNLNKNEND